MSNYNSTLQSNNIDLQEVLDTLKNKAAGGTTLPELSNEGMASELFSGKELIDSEGNVVTGAFTIDSELTTQDDLISEIQTALIRKTAVAPAEPVLQTKTVTPSTSTQTVTPDSGYDGLSRVTVNGMPTATQATPSISVNSSGLITASATQSAGYVSAGTKSGTKQLTTQAAKTITPSTSSQTAVATNVYTTGTVTVAGDENLVAENIAEGVSIFGVAGTHSGGGSGGGSVETCTVTITALMNPLTKIAAMRCIDGAFEQVSGMAPMVGSTIDNVVCGSLVTVICTGAEPSVSNATVLLTTNWVNDEGMTVYAYVFTVNYV